MRNYTTQSKNRFLSLLLCIFLTCFFSVPIFATDSIVISEVVVPTNKLSEGDTFSLSTTFYPTSSNDSITVSPSLTGSAVNATSASVSFITGGEESNSNTITLGTGQLATVKYSNLIYTGTGSEVKLTLSAGNGGGSVSQTISLNTITSEDVKGALILDSSNNNLSASMSAGESKKLSVTIKNTTTDTIKNGKAKIYFDNTTVGLSVASGNYIELSSMAPNSTKTISFTVSATTEVTAGTYPLTIELNSMKQTLYLNIDSDITPPILELSTDGNTTFTLGEANDLNIKISNVGGKNAKNIKLEVVNQSDVAVVGSSNVKYINSLAASSNTSYGTKIQLTSSTSSKLLQLQVNLSYEDESGTSYKDTQYIFLNTNTTANTNDMVISNIQSPSGTYAAGESFTVKFKVGSKNGANNVKISVNPDQNIIATSQSVFVLNELVKGQSKEYSVTFQPTESITSGTHPIQILLEYEYQDKSFSMNQYASVNTSASGTNQTNPKVILSKYTASPEVVRAGENVTLNLTFLNTHPNKTVYNLTANLSTSSASSSNTNAGSSSTNGSSTSSSSSSSTTGTTSLFTPVDATNTLFVGSLASGASSNKEITFKTSSSATAATYMMYINLTYQDEKGSEVTSSETIPITISQDTNIDVAQIDLSSLSIGRSTGLTATIYNTSKSAISNVMMYLESDALDTGFSVTDNKSYLSAFSTGATQYYAPTLTGLAAGTYDVNLVIEYEDSLGEAQVMRYPFQVEVADNNMKMMSNETDGQIQQNGPGQMGTMPGREGKSTTSNNLAIIAIVTVIIVAIIVTILILRSKKRKKDVDMNE
ncbi:hypothetical protein QTL86_19005 [Cellulosilyticum sp. ST5]|uniref:COG1361 S-layer family protein n=1 Tax=Cellulosilyticum sp. ST5 TaxID=3055805 RepID=UPI003977C2A5